jgi:predicted ester cyclase
MVALWSTFSGTQEGAMGPFPPSGKSCTTDFGGVFRIEGDRIAELWVTWDNLDMLAQLGHVEPPATPTDA